jgi:eukaryotic-like serine/threonine-protein kinase
VAELQSRLPHYEIQDVIGWGASSVVYRGYDHKMERQVALKVLRRDLVDSYERFRREARVMIRLRHPNIVGAYDFGEVGGVRYLVMEYVEGESLRGVMRRRRLSPVEIRNIGVALCAAAEAAHADGVVHRDIKPENILIDAGGRVKITDFGIAKLTQAATLNPQTAGNSGTPYYMAPEVVSGEGEVDGRADIYSLGVVLYELLTGDIPLFGFPMP